MRLPNRFRSAHAPLLVLALWLSPVHAQEPEAPFAETVNVNVVNVDVRVTDRQGNPVAGLTAADFTLREDGDGVEITNFLEVPPRPKGPAAQPAGDAAEAPSALLVFLVDDTTVEPRNRKRGLEQIRASVDEGFGPSTAATVAVIHEGLRILVQPTGDAGQLKAALQQIEEDPARGIIRQRERDAELREVLTEVGETLNGFRAGLIDSNDAVRQLNTLTRRVQNQSNRHRAENLDSFAAMGGLIEALARMPGRKAIIYVSQGLALRPGQASLEVIQQAFAEISAIGDGEASSGSIDARSAALGALSDQVRSQKRRTGQKSAPPDDLIAVSALAAKAGVSFYAWKAQSNLGVATAELGGEAALNATTSVRDARESSLTETLRILADQTGGRVAIGAGFDGLVARAITDFGGYYSLGFTPAHGGDNQLHKLKVKVRRRGVDVWYPKSYVALPQAAGPGTP